MYFLFVCMPTSQLVVRLQVKHDEHHVFTMLNATARGDIECVRGMLLTGASPNVMDYDHRTPLMLATANGESMSTFN